MYSSISFTSLHQIISETLISLLGTRNVTHRTISSSYPRTNHSTTHMHTSILNRLSSFRQTFRAREQLRRKAARRRHQEARRRHQEVRRRQKEEARRRWVESRYDNNRIVDIDLSYFCTLYNIGQVERISQWDKLHYFIDFYEWYCSSHNYETVYKLNRMRYVTLRYYGFSDSEVCFVHPYIHAEPTFLENDYVNYEQKYVSYNTQSDDPILPKNIIDIIDIIYNRTCGSRFNDANHKPENHFIKMVCDIVHGKELSLNDMNNIIYNLRAAAYRRERNCFFNTIAYLNDEFHRFWTNTMYTVIFIFMFSNKRSLIDARWAISSESFRMIYNILRMYNNLCHYV